MKRIGIIFAMEEELNAFLELVSLTEKKEIYDLTFYECTLKDKELVLVESGIGKVNAARSCQVLIDHMEVEAVFNIGVAGGVDPSVAIMDIVIGEKLVQHDFDLTAFGRPKGYITNIGDVYIPSDSHLIELVENVKTDIPIHKGVIASGDIFCSEAWMGEKIASKFQALCVEMEGASIAQVCYLCKIPFLVIRSISDSPSAGDNKITYEDFLEMSSKRVASYLKQILEQMN